MKILPSLHIQLKLDEKEEGSSFACTARKMLDLSARKLRTGVSDGPHIKQVTHGLKHVIREVKIILAKHLLRSY